MEFSARQYLFKEKFMYIIAEIGGSHQGNLSHAKELIHAVKETGANCAKFQAVFAHEIVHPKVGIVPLPTGNISIYDTFKKLERSQEFYQELKNETQKAGLDFLCTPFGLESFALLENLNVQAYKVASPELNHLPLLQAISGTNKNIFLSLGVSKISDIEMALDQISDAQHRVTLLNCVTSYPAPEEDYNLNLLPHLAAIFDVKVGISDHSMDPILVPSLSVLCGGSAIEKHICLSRKGDGLDDPIALEPSQFAAMVRSVRIAQEDPRYLHELEKQYGKDKVQAVLGDGRKRLAGSEMANYGRTNRSICALRDIQSGESLTKDNTVLLRVEKVLRPGLSPQFWPVILQRNAAQNIPAGEGIRWQDIK